MKYDLPVEYSKLHWKERKAVREQYIKQQKGLCYYCGCPLDGPPSKGVQDKWVNKRMFPKGMFDYPIHLQHDHPTDLTEGAVHARCNAVMWQYEGR